MKKILPLIGLFILTGCGLDEQLTTRIKIDIDALSGSKKSTRSTTESSELPPENISSFSCFFVNITGSGIKNFDPAQIQKVNSACLGFESISNVTDKAVMRTNGVSLTMPRSSSTSHNVNVYGVSGLPSGLSCAEGLRQTTTRPKIFLVASGTTGPLSSDMTIPVTTVYDKNTSADENIKCQVEQTVIPPAAGFSWIDTSANAHHSHLYAGTHKNVTSPPLLYDTAAAVVPPEFNATYSRITPANNEFSVNDTFTSYYNLIGIDLLFDVSNIDPNRVKSLTLTAEATLSCMDASGVESACYYSDSDLNHLIVITPSQAAASSWNCSATNYNSTTMKTFFICNNTATLTAATFSQFIFSRQIPYVTATGSTATVSRSFIHSTFRSFAASSFSSQAILTITNPKLTYGF